MTKQKAAPAVEKRKVTMTSVTAATDASGNIKSLVHEAIDYVPVDLLDAYVEDAQGKWQSVYVDEEAGHDPGPGGENGDTYYPEHLNHPLAGQTVSGSDN